MKKMPLLPLKIIAIFGLCCTVVVARWMMTAELFEVPSEVARSRTRFFNAKSQYLSNSGYWDAKQVQFAKNLEAEIESAQCAHIVQHLQEMSDEVFFAFVMKYFHLQAHKGSLTIFQKEGTPSYIIFSKEEPQWPFKVILSLEGQLRFEEGHFFFHVLRVRRGGQDIGIGQSWSYFGPELERLRGLAVAIK